MTKIPISIRSMEKTDWNKVVEIYKQGMETGNATFQHEVPVWEDWDRGHLSYCRFVAKIGNEVVGWSALSPVSSRCVYSGVAEVSVYVSTNYRGQKVGSLLLRKLIDESEENNIWTLQAGIFPENTPSIKIHEQHGFRQIGHREKIGNMNGVWRDTLLFEKRSTKIGIS